MCVCVCVCVCVSSETHGCLRCECRIWSRLCGMNGVMLSVAAPGSAHKCTATFGDTAHTPQEHTRKDAEFPAAAHTAAVSCATCPAHLSNDVSTDVQEEHQPRATLRIHTMQTLPINFEITLPAPTKVLYHAMMKV